MPAEMDHVVLVTSDLEAGMLELVRRTGVEPVPGGSHPGLGTRNALLGLTWRGQRRCYLELLAPDPAQAGGAREGMMLDLGARLRAGLDERVRAHTWVVRPDDLEARLEAAALAGTDPGEVVTASRSTANGTVLRWRLAVPRPLGLHGLQPSLIDWGGGAHPSDATMPVLELVDLVLEHPRPDRARAVLSCLGVDHDVAHGSTSAMVVVLDTPRGRVSFR